MFSRKIKQNKDSILACPKWWLLSAFLLLALLAKKLTWEVTTSPKLLIPSLIKLEECPINPPINLIIVNK